MLQAVLLDEEGKEVFRQVIDPALYDELDVWVGLLDDEKDTACGVLGALSTPDGENGHALTISLVSLAEGYGEKGGQRVLVRYLQDLASELECSAVFCMGEFLDGADDENEALMASLGFYVEKETLPLYVFHLSDISVKKTKGDFGRLRLSDLKPVQWEDFVEETDYSDFFVTEIEDYEKDLSIFLVDDDRKIQAGALFALRGDVLFVEGIFAYGSDEETLLNDLIYWGTEGAKKHLPPDKQVDIFLPGGKTYRDILMEVTDKKAKRVGNLMTYTCQVPI